MKRSALLVALALALTVPVTADEVTRQEAVAAIDDAEEDILAVMEVKNNTQRLNDSLSEARLAFRQARYATFIENGTESSFARLAAQAMEGLDVERYGYGEVVEHTDEVERLRRTALSLADRLVATRLRVQEAREDRLNISTAVALLDEAETAWRREQYEQVDTTLSAVHQELDEERSQRSVTMLVAASGVSFLERYRNVLLGGGVAFLLIGGILYHIAGRIRKRRRFRKLQQQVSIAQERMEEVQELYFVEEDLSKSVYEARMHALRERLSQVEEELATVADRLGRDLE